MRSSRRRHDILYVGFLLGHGGDALQMLDLAVGMRARGRSVKLVVPAIDTTVDFQRRARDRGIDVERSPLIRAAEGGVNQSIPNLILFFLTHRGGILHTHTGDVCLPRSVLVVMGLLRLPPAFVTIHSPYDDMKPTDPRARRWVKAVPRRFHAVFCPSEHGRRTQLELGVDPAHLITIHNSVDTARFANGRADVAYDALGVPRSSRLIMFTSRLDKQKRPLDAVEAFRLIATAHPDTHLVFVGSGVLEAAIREAAVRAELGSRVHLVGYQDNVEDWLAAACVWILPTEHENFSLAVLEALAAGCAIVSTRSSGNDEMLDDGVNALVTEVGDVAAQAHAVTRLLDDHVLRRRLQQAAREGMTGFDTKRMIDDYSRCYERSVGRDVTLGLAD